MRYSNFGQLFLEVLILLVTANEAEKQTASREEKYKWESKGTIDNTIGNEQGFKMFSMMDFPQRSLQEYSLDPVQRLIYSDDDLGHINGILTDREVIDESITRRVNGKMKRTRNGEDNVIKSYKPKKGDYVRGSKLSMDMKKPTQKQKITSRRKKVLLDDLMRKGTTIKATVRDEIENILPKRGFDDNKSSISKGFKSSRGILSKRIPSKLTDRRDFPTAKSHSDKLRTTLENVERAPILYGQYTIDSLTEIQKSVSLDKMLKPSGKKQKSPRSAEDRGRKIDEMIEKQLKLLKRASSSRAKTASKPNERDFFFFKDAFEYGTRLLAKKLAKGEPVDTSFKENIITASPNSQTIQVNNDLEKIKASVEQNMIRTDQEKVERRVGHGNGYLDNEKISQKHTEMPTSVPTTQVSGTTYRQTYGLNIVPSNQIIPNHKDAVQKSLLKESTGKQTPTEFTMIPFTVKSLGEQKGLKSYSVPTKPSKTTMKVNKIQKNSDAVSRITEKNTMQIPQATMKNVIVDEMNSTALQRKKNLVTRGKPTKSSSGSIHKQNIFAMPEWKLPPFYYRRPCPTKADVMFRSHDNKIYAVDGKMVHIIGSYGVEIGPMPLQFVWPEVEGTVDDGYVRLLDRMLFLFFKDKYAAYIKDRELVGEPSKISAIGLPISLTPIDAVSSWTGNGKTYYFRNDYYWRYNDWENRLDAGYPKQIKQHWRKVPDNVDTAFIAPNSHLYFLKGGSIYKMHRYRASVQYRYPKKLSESCYDFFI